MQLGLRVKELLASGTSKRQVTIPPIEVRRLLGVAPQDKVAFVIEDEQVHLVRRGSVVAQTAGALRTEEGPRTGTQLREEAEHAIAQEAMRRGLD